MRHYQFYEIPTTTTSSGKLRKSIIVEQLMFCEVLHCQTVHYLSLKYFLYHYSTYFEHLIFSRTYYNSEWWWRVLREGYVGENCVRKSMWCSKVKCAHFTVIDFLLSYCWPIFYTSNFDQKSRVQWILMCWLTLLWICMKIKKYIPKHRRHYVIFYFDRGNSRKGHVTYSLHIKFTNRVLENRRIYVQIKRRSCIILINSMLFIILCISVICYL